MGEKTDDVTRMTAQVGRTHEQIAQQQALLGQLHGRGDHEGAADAERLLEALRNNLADEVEKLACYKVEAANWTKLK